MLSIYAPIKFHKKLKEFIAKEYGEEKAELYSKSLMLHIYGLRVFGYQHHTKEDLLETLQLGLPWLPWETSS